MAPPSSMPATPCFTAFSTSGCSSSGGDGAFLARRRDFFHHPQPLAEAHLLHFQIAPGQRQLLAQRDALAAAQAQAAAQKIGQPDAHFARACAILRGQRGDGMQAVEQEMRVESGCAALAAPPPAPVCALRPPGVPPRATPPPPARRNAARRTADRAARPCRTAAPDGRAAAVPGPAFCRFAPPPRQSATRPPPAPGCTPVDAIPKVIARLCQRSGPRGSVPQMYQGDRQANAYTRQEGASTTAASIQVMPPDAHMTYTSSASSGTHASRYSHQAARRFQKRVHGGSVLEGHAAENRCARTISRFMSGCAADGRYGRKSRRKRRRRA